MITMSKGTVEDYYLGRSVRELAKHPQKRLVRYNSKTDSEPKSEKQRKPSIQVGRYAKAALFSSSQKRKIYI